MYTYKIYEESEAKYNQEAAILNDCGIMIAICPLEEAEYIVYLKNQWEERSWENFISETMKEGRRSMAELDKEEGN